MIKVLVSLHNDHRNLDRIASLVESRAAASEPPDNADLVLLADTLYYLMHFPDLYHHPRENVLAQWLNRIGALRPVIVETLAAQHADIEEQGSGLLRDLESMVRAETQSWDGLSPRLKRYAASLRANMATEEAELLPVAFAEALHRPRGAPPELQLADVRDPLFSTTDDERFRQLQRAIISEAKCECPAPSQTAVALALGR